MTTSLQQGIDAAKSGLMEEALVHLKDAIVEEPENSNVWVWLAAIIDDEEKQTIFLKKALEIDPGNRPAQRGLAFIERKKYVPPKPGETLSDYTKPIGVFKTPSAAAQSVIASSPPRPAQVNAPQKSNAVQEAVSPVPVQEVATPVKSRPWLDIVLYGVTLMVFIVIGILIGTTLLNIDLPFLIQPTPVLGVLPPKEGVFVREGDEFMEMKIKLSKPEDLTGAPITTQKIPAIVINTLMIKMERVQLMDENWEAVPFQTLAAEQSMHILTPQIELTTGRYCLSYELNPEENEALYWCLQVE